MRRFPSVRAMIHEYLGVQTPSAANMDDLSDEELEEEQHALMRAGLA